MKPFITTFTGKKVNPLDLQVEDICVEDIAHHLACINRFVGALKEPISIAHHSIHVCKLLEGTGWEREGLFHDATETYLGDVTKWLKHTPEMQAFRDAEDRAWLIICKALDLRPEGTPELNADIKWADDLMVRYEALMLSANPQHMFDLPSHPRPTDGDCNMVRGWYPMSWDQAEAEFLLYAGAMV